MKFNLPKELCLNLADLDGNHEIGAGSLPVLIDEMRSSGSRTEKTELAIVRGVAFGRFVLLKRRSLGLTPDELAAKTKLDLSEILSMEQDNRYEPEPTAITQLAKLFEVPIKALMQLAGLSKPRDARFYSETIKFAARSESSAKLSVEEREVLEHFAAVLSEEK
jgi:transcriptional regulator with XRE-family HTH domain